MTDPDYKKKNSNHVAKYSSVGFQMMAIIGLFAFIGYKIDEYNHNKTLIFTAMLSLIGVVISLYQVVRQSNKNEE